MVLFSSRFCQSFLPPLCLPCFHFRAPFAFIQFVVGVIFHCVFFCTYSCSLGSLITYFNYFFPLLLFLCGSLFSCSLSFSTLFPFFPFRVFSFLIQGFPFRSCCGYMFSIFTLIVLVLSFLFYINRFSVIVFLLELG